MGRGIPCGASYIAPWKKCIKGVGVDHQIFQHLDSPSSEKLQKALTEFHDNLEKHIPEEAHKNWEGAINNLMSSFKDFPMDDSQRETFLEKKLIKQLKEGERMMVNQPRYLDINGTKIEAPTDLIPKFGVSQSGWYDPRLNLSFNARGVKNNGIASVKKQSGGGSQTELHVTGQLSSMLNYRMKQLAEGKPWPSEPVRKPTQSEIDKVYNEVKGKEIWRVGGNLMDTNRTRDELLKYYEILNKNPSPEVKARRESKSKAMIASWLSYDKKSPVTGELIDLVPSNPQGGKFRSTVDHKVPLTELAKNLGSVTDPVERLKRLIQRSDTPDNFHIVEAGLNAMKNKGSWSDVVTSSNPDKWAERVSQNLRRNPPVMGLNQKAFEDRFGESSKFDNPATRSQIAKSHEDKRINSVLNGEILENIKNPVTPPKVRAVRSPRQTKQTKLDALVDSLRKTPSNLTNSSTQQSKPPVNVAKAREAAFIASATTLANNMKQRGLPSMQVRYELRKLGYSPTVISQISI